MHTSSAAKKCFTSSEKSSAIIIWGLRSMEIGDSTIEGMIGCQAPKNCLTEWENSQEGPCSIPELGMTEKDGMLLKKRTEL